MLGCNGLLSGSGSVIADLQARLFRAVQENDLAEAKRLNERIEPTARVFYADPFVDMHNRMKEALVLLGKLPRAVVRPPLVKIERAEVARIRQALIEAGLLDKNAARRGVKCVSWPGLSRPSMMNFNADGISVLPGLRLTMDARVKPAHDRGELRPFLFVMAGLVPAIHDEFQR